MSLAGCAFAHRAAAAAFLAFAGWACFSSGSCHVDGAMFCLLVSSCGRLTWARRYLRTHSPCYYRAELCALAAYPSFFYVSSAVRTGRKVQFEDCRAFSCGVQPRQIESLSLSLRMQQQHMLAISSVAVSTYGSRVEVAENSTIWCVVPSALSGWSADCGDFPVGLGEQFANLISR